MDEEYVDYGTASWTGPSTKEEKTVVNDKSQRKKIETGRRSAIVFLVVSLLTTFWRGGPRWYALIRRKRWRGWFLYLFPLIRLGSCFFVDINGQRTKLWRRLLLIATEGQKKHCCCGPIDRAERVFPCVCVCVDVCVDVCANVCVCVCMQLVESGSGESRQRQGRKAEQVTLMNRGASQTGGDDIHHIERKRSCNYNND